MSTYYIGVLRSGRDCSQLVCVGILKSTNYLCTVAQVASCSVVIGVSVPRVINLGEVRGTCPSGALAIT